MVASEYSHDLPNYWHSLIQKLGRGLSLLPKSRGDEASWSLMINKILLCANSQLNDAFQGLEEGTWKSFH